MQVWSTNSGWFQIFKYDSDEKTFTNVSNMKVLDVTGGKDAEGQTVIVYAKHGKTNQRWSVLYTDQVK
jgi:hypothetical protein